MTRMIHTPPRSHARRPQDSAAIEQWLRDFAACVRDVDYDRGRPMFDERVYGFGTVADAVEGRDALIDAQWRNVWGVTSGFDFDYAGLRCDCDGDTGWAAARWSSQGRRDGKPFVRTGRATFTFRRAGVRWVAVHSHFSMDPSGLPRSV